MAKLQTVSGTVKRLIADKKFGFLKDEAGTEYFFHQSALRGVGFEELAEGDKVMFLPSQGPKGPRADSVQRDFS